MWVSKSVEEEVGHLLSLTAGAAGIRRLLSDPALPACTAAVAGWLLSAKLLLQDLERPHAASISLQPLLAAAVCCNSMFPLMRGNNFLIGIYIITSVRTKEMNWVNKHITVNPNKQKWKPFNMFKVFLINISSTISSSCINYIKSTKWI